MNCYYSNLIEGHDTRPVDIERALHADFAAEPKRRDLQLEAAAHIAVQAAIDTDAIDATQPLSILARDIHRQFYEPLPDSRTACAGRMSWGAAGGSQWCRARGGTGT